jgi:diacylglycerol kinase family enzyme
MNFYINALMGRRVRRKKKQDDINPDFYISGKTPRIGVIVNPLSGGNVSGLGKVRTVIADYPAVFSRDVQTPEDISAALADFARNRVNLLAVNGGDGTVQAVLTHLFHHKPFKTLPMLAVLQSGTTSMTARDVGFSGSRVKSLRKLFKWGTTAEGEPQEIQRPVLKVEAPGHPARYGMFFGAAAIYQGIQYFHSKLNTKGLKGEIGPGLTILRFLWAALSQRSNFIPPVPIAVELDDQPPRQFDSFVVLVSTLERLFLGLYPYWGSESGPLHYTALRAQPQNLLRALPSILRGRQSSYATPQNGFYSHNAHEIKLNLDSGFTLDGQLYTPETRQEPTVVRYGGTASFLRI